MSSRYPIIDADLRIREEIEKEFPKVIDSALYTMAKYREFTGNLQDVCVLTRIAIKRTLKDYGFYLRST